MEEIIAGGVGLVFIAIIIFTILRKKDDRDTLFDYSFNEFPEIDPELETAIDNEDYTAASEIVSLDQEIDTVLLGDGEEIITNLNAGHSSAGGEAKKTWKKVTKYEKERQKWLKARKEANKSLRVALQKGSKAEIETNKDKIKKINKKLQDATEEEEKILAGAGKAGVSLLKVILKGEEEFATEEIENGEVLLRIKSYVSKQLISNPKFQKVFNTLYNKLHTILNLAIENLKKDYGFFPAEKDPASTLLVFFVSKQTRRRCCVKMYEETIVIIVPISYIKENPKDIYRTLLHEASHTCAQMKHGEEKMSGDLKSFSEKALKDEKEEIKKVDTLLAKELGKLKLGENHDAVTEVLDDYKKYMYENFDNKLADLGISIIHAKRRDHMYIESELGLILNNTKHYGEVLKLLKDKRTPQNKPYIDLLQYQIAVFAYPDQALPYWHTAKHKYAASKAIQTHESNTRTHCSEEVFRAVRNIGVSYQDLISKHTPDIVIKKFDVEKIIHDDDFIENGTKILEQILKYHHALSKRI